MTPNELQNQAHYNRWANQRLFEASANLTAEERERDLRASFVSLQDTLIHILWGERGWLSFFQTGNFVPRPAPATTQTSPASSSHGPPTTKRM